MDIKIVFERENENNPLEKTIVLKAKIKTSLGRKNKTISETAFTQPYRIHQRVFNKLFQTADRGDWEKVKNHFSNFYWSSINSYSDCSQQEICTEL